jgi:guanylate kinase
MTAPPVTAASPVGQLIVLTGPSGVGKGTLLKRLRQRHPNLYLSISATTRPPRSGEVDGQQYYFLDRAAFEAMVAAGESAGMGRICGQLLRYAPATGRAADPSRSDGHPRN